MKFKCPKCGSIMEVTSLERPLQVKCPVCNTVGVLRAKPQQPQYVPPVYYTDGIKMYCQKCGTQLPDGSVFCNKCGTPINPMATIDKTGKSMDILKTKSLKHSLIAISVFLIGVGLCFLGATFLGEGSFYLMIIGAFVMFCSAMWFFT